MKAFFKRNLIFALQPIITRLVTFVVLPMYTLRLSTADYGTLDLLITCGIFFKTIVSMSTTTSFWKFTAKEENNDFKEVVFNICAIPFLLSLVFGIVLLPFIIYFWSDNMLLIIFYCCSELFLTIYGVANLVVRNSYNSKSFLMTTLLYIFCFISLTYISLIVLNFGIRGIIATYLISAIISLIFSYFLILRKNIKVKLDIRLIRDIILYSFPLMISNVLFILLGFSDRFFIKGFRTPSELGLYSYYQKFGGLVRATFIDIFFSIWNPIRWRIYHHSFGKSIFLHVMRTFRLFNVMLVMPFHILLVYLANTLTSNQEYVAQVQLISLIVLGQLQFSLYYLGISGLLFASKTNLITRIVGLSFILNLILSFWLVPKYGIIASALITSLNYYIMATIAFYTSQTFYKLPIRFTENVIYNLFILIQLPILVAYCYDKISLYQLLCIYSILLGIYLYYLKTSGNKINFKIIYKLNEIR